MHDLIRQIAALGLASILLAALIGCAGDGRSGSRSQPAAGKMTYDDAVRSMRRPPTSAHHREEIR